MASQQDKDVNVCSLSTDDSSVLAEMPFYSLSNIDLSLVTEPREFSGPNFNLNNILQIRSNEIIADTFMDFDATRSNSKLDNNSLYVTLEDLGQLPTNLESLSVLQVNCRSLKKNFDQVKILLSNFSSLPSVIALSETWLSPSDQTSLFNLPGYSFISVPRKLKRGGGTGLYVSDDINYIVREDIPPLPEEVCEYCTIEILNDHLPNVIIMSLYRPPDSDITLFDISITKVLNHLFKSAGRKKIILAADWNVDLLKLCSNKKIDQFLSNMESVGLLPTVTVPTRITERTASLLDNIFINCVSDEYYTRVIYSDISDHLPVLLNISLKSFKKAPAHLQPPLSYSFSKRNFLKFKPSIANEDWDSLESRLSLMSPNLAYETFFFRFKQIFDNCFSTTIPSENHKRLNGKKLQPWITLNLLKSCRKKSRLLKIYKKTGSFLARQNYIKYKNVLKQLLRHEEKVYYNSQFLAVAGDIRKTWKLINQVINKNNKSSNSHISLKIAGVTSQNESEIVNSFNDFFVNIGPNLASKIISPSGGGSVVNTIPLIRDSISVMPSDSYEVKAIIASIKESSSCGVDSIPIAAIKSVSDVISPVLSSLINLSITSGIFPDALKVAKVTPIYKSGDKTLTANYRPISLLNTFSKIYEKVFLKRLVSFSSKHNIIYDNQYGFRRHHSTQSALVSFVDLVTDSLDRNEYVLSVFIDLSKAFDTIDHAILLRKLSNYGIRGVALEFIKSYLFGRTQCVEINGVRSEFKSITCGVPQGSSLGPFLFLLYINDLHRCTKLLKLLLFADDTTLIYSSRDLNELINIVNTELVHLARWFNLNKLSLNASKSNYMIFGNRKKCPSHSDLMIGNSRLIQVRSTKFLGVIVDDKLSWTDHINTVNKKLSSAAFVIRNVRYKINFEVSLKLYDTLALPYLTYCNIIWGNACKTYVKNTVRIQKRILKMCCDNVLNKRVDVFKQTSKLPLYSINVLQILVLIFKFFYNPHTLPKSALTLFKAASSVHRFNTRSANRLGLYNEYARLNVRKTCVRISGPLLWNSIPLEIREIANIGLFKQSLKTYFLSNLPS